LMLIANSSIIQNSSGPTHVGWSLKKKTG